MARDYRPVDREQSFLLPPSMVEWLPQDHSVWFMLAAVDRLDTSAFHAKARRGGVGRAGYDPDMLLSLFVYAMAQGVSSSRRIEQLCQTDVAFRLICAQDVPDHTVLARFRQAHQGALEDLLAATLELAAQLGMVRLGVVALDGTKIAANASPKANRREARLRELAAEYVSAAERTDRAEDELFGAGCRGDELPPGVGDRSSRAGRIDAAIEQIEQQKQDQRDAAAARAARAQEFDRQVAAGRVMRGKTPAGADDVGRYRRRYEQVLERQRAEYRARQARREQDRAVGRRLTRVGVVPEEYFEVRKARARYEQALAEQQAQPVVEAESSGAGRRGDRRGPMANMTDPDSRKMKTRNGWVQGFNCQTAVSQDWFFLMARVTQDANDLNQFTPTMTALVGLAERLGQLTAPPIGPKSGIGILLGDKGYDTDANLEAPGPDRLIPAANDDAEPDTSDGEEAADQGPPTSEGHGAQEDSADDTDHPAPPDDATAREKMRHRLRTAEGKALYSRRSGIVEPGNGWLKDRRGLRRFARRGQQAAQSELAFACAVSNLLRIATLGVTAQQLKATA